ncbi:MAG: hypothetical protein KGL03_07775 [Nitrospirota bacterium]|nr:hypothetical protein [Nitrospirota bacterium]
MDQEALEREQLRVYLYEEAKGDSVLCWWKKKGRSMAGKAKKAEHAGPKKGSGAYWGRKVDAKRESNRARRETAKRAVRFHSDV